MRTNEFVEYAEELGYLVEEDDFSIVIWVVSGRHKNIKNKVAWVSKVVPNNFKVLSILHPKKEDLIDVLVQYAKTTKARRGNKYRYKQNIE